MIPAEYYTKEERKLNGVFYTPSFLSDYLAEKIMKYVKIKHKLTSVLDPACGNSILLESLSMEMLNYRIKNLPTIYGIDKDNNAIISSNTKFKKNELLNFSSKFLNTDGLFPNNGNNSDDDWFIFRNKLQIFHGFDIIVSNPPWGSDLNGYTTQKLIENFTLARGQYDIYDLFTEVILKNLSQTGVYGLILPDSVFSQEQARFRFMLAKNTTINLIARLGEKIFPEINRACVIIIGNNGIANENHLVDCFRLNSNFKKKILSKQLQLYDAEIELLHKVPQNRFLNNNNCTFNIDLKISEQSIIDKIEQNNIFLNNYVINTRGAEISKKGLVCQCPKCQHWMPFPKAINPKCNNCKSSIKIESCEQEKIILNYSKNGYSKLKTGEDLYRYTSISKSWINTSRNGINYKNLDIYLDDKILVRKTGVGITASLDYESSITNQVVYILKLRPEFKNILTLEFILSILNSRVMSYYLIKKYGENEWRSHPYLTQTILINLPFPQIDFKSAMTKRIIKKITNIVKNEIANSNEKNISKTIDLILEKTVAHLFNLNRRDYITIFKTLSSSEQLIPIKRLLNCSIDEIFKSNGI